MRTLYTAGPVVIALVGILAYGLAVTKAQAQDKGGQELYGHFELVEDWPLWFDDAAHAGWTWGSAGGVFAESPDRIWIAQRGELPLPENTESGTPYGATDRGNSTGNSDGFNARCGPTDKRGWERRWHLQDETPRGT